MKTLLLGLYLVLQAGPQNVGVVSGVVRGANGMPAPGVRVYAIGVRESLDASNLGGAPLEGLTQTDASGRYRLEASPGRYYIASGSVNSPTFYPGSRTLTGARVVTVTSGGLVEAVDFSSFVPPAPSGFISLPTGTGVLAGTLRFPDGTPAAGIPVVAVPSSTLPGGPVPSAATSPPKAPLLFNQFGLIMVPPAAPPPSSAPGATLTFSGFTVTSRMGLSGAISDGAGKYIIQNLPSDTYFIAAGFAESPTLLPGVTDPLAAKTFVTTATTNLNGLDFMVPRPPVGVAVRGRVTTLGGGPAGGTMVEIAISSPVVASAYGLPTGKPNRMVEAGPDGRFEFRDVFSGSYRLAASYGRVGAESRNIVVGDQPLADLDFSLRVSALSGHILAEDGSSIPDVQLFAAAIVSTVSNPNIIASTIFEIASDGSFGRILEPEEYRFFLRALPEEYSIKSIDAGGVDLLRETFKFSGNEPVRVEVRVAKRVPSSDPAAVSVRGRAVDALTGMPSAAERITLCCRASGPVQRFSASLNPADGSFEFAAIPAGQYAVGLDVKSGTPNLFVVGGNIDVGTEHVSGLELASASQLGEITAKIVLEDGSLPSDRFPASVVFTGANGRVRVVAHLRSGIHRAALPIGGRYNVSVIDLPEGYVVKSVSGSTEVRPANYPASAFPPAPAPIVITLAPQAR